MFQEQFATKPKVKGGTIKHHNLIGFSLEKSAFSLSKTYSGSSGYYPVANLKAVNHFFTDPKNTKRYEDLKDGDVVAIGYGDDTNNKIGYLATSSTTHNVFYYPLNKGGYYFNWIIQKVYNKDNDPYIRMGEPILIQSQAFKGQYLCPSMMVGYTETFLTTDPEIQTFWYLS
jgi:hypothetical protein